MSLSRRFIYGNTTPWRPGVRSAYGPGSEYPVRTALKGTCKLYWKPRALVANVGGSVPGFAAFSSSATGDDRAAECFDLRNSLGGTVSGAISNILHLTNPIAIGSFSWTFTLGADSALDTARAQYLAMRFEATFNSNSSLGGGSVLFSSVSTLFANDAGYIEIDGFIIPLFASIAGASLSGLVTWSDWQFAG